MPYLICHSELKMKKQPKFISDRHNKHAIIMNPSYSNKFEEYKLIGVKNLEERAKLIKNNKEFADKVYL